MLQYPLNVCLVKHGKAVTQIPLFLTCQITTDNLQDHDCTKYFRTSRIFSVKNYKIFLKERNVHSTLFNVYISVNVSKGDVAIIDHYEKKIAPHIE